MEGILRGRVERSRITKSILVIDEAQDLGVQEFELVKELIRLNDDMRVIAVGDDDQNIYEFRGSDSGNMKSLITDYGASVYDMMENFRSSEAVVSISNNYVKGMSNRLKSAPIICRRSDRGCVRLIHHASLDYEQAIVNEILSGAPGGTVCVLTATNDDALVISALLNKSGRRARLIRSNDGFYLRDLAEFRFFLDTIREFDAACLDNDTWTKSAEMVVEHFRGSECLEMFRNCLEAFNEECPGRKYISDFENFLLESRLEDFSKSRSSEIIVSTIHKSKGCEYDNVYISLKGLGDITDRERRMIYVGMTRAKNNLSVHFSNVNLFLDKSLQRFIIEDNTVYGAPMEVLMQLSHRDVVLDIFKGCQDSLPGLLSGTGLFVSGDYLYAETGGRRVKVLRFSSAFRTQLSRMVSKGYLPVKAKVRFQVFWSYEEPTGETGSPTRSEIMIVLPDLLLAL